MTIDDFLTIASEGVQMSILVSAPVLLMGLVAGVAISIVQAATQINDSSLAFIPKILAVTAALMIFGPWMMSKLATFTTMAFNQIPNVTY
jgi:flagellar biosynthetic protein FliQ